MPTKHALITVGLSLAVAACSGPPSGVDDPDLVCTIPENRIFFGGIDRDGIPSLLLPSISPVDEDDFMFPNDRVLGIVVNGVPRAYPMPVMWWHEIVNDTLGGENVLVSYCPLTGSGIVFNPVVGGELRTFGVSGLLFENNLIMFDRQTESLWNQMSLGSVCGVDRGTSLVRRPVVETTWRHWKERYPETTVVNFDTGFNRDYGRYPYPGYDDPNSAQLTFPSSAFSSERPPKELNIGIVDGPDAVVYPFGSLADLGGVAAVNDSLNGLPFLVTWVDAENTATVYDRRVNGQALTFTVADEATATFVDTETGTTWNTNGLAISGTHQGVQLQVVPDAFVAFWFAWSVYFPELRLAL